MVYSFDQSFAGQVSYAGKFPASANIKEGYCLGLSVQWTTLRLHGRDFVYAPNRALSPSQTYAAASDHATYLKSFNAQLGSIYNLLFTSGDAFNVSAANTALVPYKLKIGLGGGVHTGRPEAGFFLERVMQMPGISLLLWIGTSCAHATVADCRRSQGLFNYFEPITGIPSSVALSGSCSG